MTAEAALARLSAGLAEDEAIARAAIQINVYADQTGEWVTRGEFNTAVPGSTVVFAVGKDGSLVQAAECQTSWLQGSGRQHIARQDPAATLLRVAAIRAGIAERDRVIAAIGECHGIGSRQNRDYLEAFQDGCEAVLSLLASVYDKEGSDGDR